MRWARLLEPGLRVLLPFLIGCRAASSTPILHSGVVRCLFWLPRLAIVACIMLRHAHWFSPHQTAFRVAA
ncbi:hypothetical protein ACP70R_022309 [Stipagrostis hirtigluma subsp. patula]